MARSHGSIGCERSVFAAVALITLLGASCTDDFSRFNFGAKNTARARDAGSQNVSGTGGNTAQSQADGTLDAGTAQSQLPSGGGAGARGSALDAGSKQPPARGPGDADAANLPDDRDD